MKQTKSHIFNKQRWKIDLNADLPEVCDEEYCGITDHKKKTIKINRRGHTAKELMGSEIHEALHAIYPYLAEDAISRGEKELASWLWKRGYRLMQKES